MNMLSPFPIFADGNTAIVKWVSLPQKVQVWYMNELEGIRFLTVEPLHSSYLAMSGAWHEREKGYYLSDAEYIYPN